MPEELRGLEANGTTRTVVKNERTYYSSRDFYRLRGVLHLVRDKGFSLERAHARVESAATLASATTH